MNCHTELCAFQGCDRRRVTFLGTQQDNADDMKAKGRARGPFKISERRAS